MAESISTLPTNTLTEAQEALLEQILFIRTRITYLVSTLRKLTMSKQLRGQMLNNYHSAENAMSEDRVREILSKTKKGNSDMGTIVSEPCDDGNAKSSGRYVHRAKSAIWDEVVAIGMNITEFISCFEKLKIDQPIRGQLMNSFRSAERAMSESLLKDIFKMNKDHEMVDARVEFVGHFRRCFRYVQTNNMSMNSQFFNYPHIPDYLHSKYKNQSPTFLKRANAYFQTYEDISKYRRLFENAQRIQNEKREELYATCDHKYVAEPREYQTPREWTCEICGHRL